MTKYSLDIKQRTDTSDADVKNGTAVYYTCWGDHAIIAHGFAASETEAKIQAQHAVDRHAAGVLPGWKETYTVGLSPTPQPDPDLEDPGIYERRQWKWWRR